MMVQHTLKEVVDYVPKIQVAFPLSEDRNGQIVFWVAFSNLFGIFFVELLICMRVNVINGKIKKFVKLFYEQLESIMVHS